MTPTTIALLVVGYLVLTSRRPTVGVPINNTGYATQQQPNVLQQLLASLLKQQQQQKQSGGGGGGGGAPVGGRAPSSSSSFDPTFGGVLQFGVSPDAIDLTNNGHDTSAFDWQNYGDDSVPVSGDGVFGDLPGSTPSDGISLDGLNGLFNNYQPSTPTLSTDPVDTGSYDLPSFDNSGGDYSGESFY